MKMLYTAYNFLVLFEEKKILVKNGGKHHHAVIECVFV